MARLRPTLSDNGYKNWVKGGLALKFSREGIENFIEINIDTFHKDVMNSLSSAANCSNCSTENIIQCRYNNNFCKFKKNTCQVHDQKDPTKTSRPCPNNVCNLIRNKILNNHRFRGPSWRNTDSTRWCREPWQLATCYMPPTGYAATNTASETDITGLLNVVINNKVFDTEIMDDMTKDDNIFCKARDARNEILHKADMQLTDTELADYITTLDNMLSDPKHLAGHPDAIRARQLLQQLLNGTLNITERHEAEVLAEALRAIDDKIYKAIAAVNKAKDNARDDIKSEKEEAMTAIRKEKDNARDGIKSEKEEAMTAVRKVKDNARDGIKLDKEEAMTAVRKEMDNARDGVKSDKNEAVKVINKAKDDAINDMKFDKDEFVAAINKEKDNVTNTIKSEKDEAVTTMKTEAEVYITSKQEEAVTMINTKEKQTKAALQDALIDALRIIKEKNAAVNSQTFSADSYTKLKKDLKAELLSIYQDNEHLTTPMSSLDPSEDKHIDQLYVTPNMKLVDHRRVQKDEGTPIKTYKDIFKERNKKIYIVGEAGTGKTAFCQKMVSLWCQVQTIEIEHLENMSDNQLAMTNFDFLFYISLRDETTQSNVEEMIIRSLLPNKPSLHEPLSQVLKEERCLIVLDGLDEWSTENKTISSSHINKGTPGSDSVRNCTVITTTRPWKLEVLQLKSSQIDTKVKLLGINETSIASLALNMIIHLNDVYSKQKTFHNFLAEINEKNIKDLLTIPVILKQIVWLWYLGKELGKTKTAIYCQMFDLVMELAQTRLEKDAQYQHKKEEWMKSSINLPPCLDGNQTCQNFKPLIAALAKLAFLSLLSNDQESALVFKSTNEGCYPLSQEEVNICLKIGILCQSKILMGVVSPLKKISFWHKTYQEFLAAIFISIEHSNTKQSVEKIQTFCNTKLKCYEMSNVLTFISGTCTSAITCTLVQHYDYFDIDEKIDILLNGVLSLSSIIVDCMREGWTCSHDNKHLYCVSIAVRGPSEYLDQLCKVNIPNIKELFIVSPPTAQCLQHLLQIHTFERLEIYPSTPPSSEDLLYTLVQNNRHTLTIINIGRMTLRSNTKLSTLIFQVLYLKLFGMMYISLPQQLLTSIQALHSPHRCVIIFKPILIPDTESTD